LYKNNPITKKFFLTYDNVFAFFLLGRWLESVYNRVQYTKSEFSLFAHDFMQQKKKLAF